MSPFFECGRAQNNANRVFLQFGQTLSTLARIFNVLLSWIGCLLAILSFISNSKHELCFYRHSTCDGITEEQPKDTIPNGFFFLRTHIFQRYYTLMRLGSQKYTHSFSLKWRQIKIPCSWILYAIYWDRLIYVHSFHTFHLTLDVFWRQMKSIKRQIRTLLLAIKENALRFGFFLSFECWLMLLWFFFVSFICRVRITWIILTGVNVFFLFFMAIESGKKKEQSLKKTAKHTFPLLGLKRRENNYFQFEDGENGENPFSL